MLPITQNLLTNYNRPGRKLKALRGIIIHWTANTNRGANALANRNYFNTTPFIRDARGNKVYASAHYLVDDRTILQCLPDDEVGFHVGAKWHRYKADAFRLMRVAQPLIPSSDSPNNYTIGIEMCVNADGDFDRMRANTIDLTRHLMQKYQIGRRDVLRHYDITGKDCPRMMLEQAIWSQFLDEVEGQIRRRVSAKELNVRIGPGTSFAVVRKLIQGEVVSVLQRQEAWLRIGPDEWINGGFTEPA